MWQISGNLDMVEVLAGGEVLKVCLRKLGFAMLWICIQGINFEGGEVGCMCASP